MADEEKQDQEETTEDAAPEEQADAPEAAEEAAADETASAEEEVPVEDEAPPAPAEVPDEDDEPLTRKQERKLARSRASGPARPQRDPAERSTERAEARKRGAADRRRYRQGRRARGGEPGQGTPAADRAPGPKKVRLGRVVSTKANKTITVRIEFARRHPTYEKVVRRSATLHAHDAANEAQEGDTVRVVETRPLSKTKHWRLLEIVERAR